MPRFCFMASAAALVLAVVFGGCGDGSSKDELPSGTAGSLRSTLDDVQQRVNDRDCTGASQQAATFREKVDALPDRVDSKLRRALSSSADRLATLVSDQCTPEPAVTPEEPPAGATSEGQVQEPQNQDDQSQDGKKDKKPKKEKPPKEDQTQTEPPPDTGGAGDQGGVTSPEG
jgi:hypothetical protein